MQKWNKEKENFKKFSLIFLPSPSHSLYLPPLNEILKIFQSDLLRKILFRLDEKKHEGGVIFLVLLVSSKKLLTLCLLNPNFFIRACITCTDH